MVSNPNSGRRQRQRAIRERMSRTGETYVVAARRHDEEVGRTVADRTPVTRCPDCSEGVVTIDVTPRCQACGTTWESGPDLAIEYAGVFLGLDWYSSVKDGGDPPTVDCPDCGESAVVTVRQEDATLWTMLCLSCEAPWNFSCLRCGAPMRHREEGDGTACDACWEVVMQRD